MTLKLRRHCSGSYSSLDGRFEIVKDPSFRANMLGAFSTPWDVYSSGRYLRSFATLAEARHAIERHLAKKSA